MKTLFLTSTLAVALSTLGIGLAAPGLPFKAVLIFAGRTASSQEKQSQKQTGVRQSEPKTKSHLDVPDEYGRTLLMRAGARGDLEDVKKLLGSGANVDASNGDGYSALMYTAYYGNAEVVEYLLAEGADVNAKDKNGLTALMEAAKQNLDAGDVMASYVDTVKALLRKGADVSLQDKDGLTALMYAEKYGRRNKNEIVRLLKDADTEK